MKGTYDVTLKDGELPDKDVIRQQNWYKVEEYITNLPQSVKHSLECGALLKIKRSDIPRSW